MGWAGVWAIAWRGRMDELERSGGVEGMLKAEQAELPLRLDDLVIEAAPNGEFFATGVWHCGHRRCFLSASSHCAMHSAPNTCPQRSC